MRTAHNKIIANLVQVGVHSSVQTPVTPITPSVVQPSVTPITPSFASIVPVTVARFLEPESPIIEQQPPTTFTGTVYQFGKMVDQTGQVHFVRNPSWTGPRKAKLPEPGTVAPGQVHKQADEWNGEHWEQPAWTTCCHPDCNRRAVVGHNDVHEPIFCCRGCHEFHTLEDTPRKPGLITTTTTTKSALEIPNTTSGPCLRKGEIRQTGKNRRSGKQRGWSLAQHLVPVSQKLQGYHHLLQHPLLSQLLQDGIMNFQ